MKTQTLIISEKAKRDINDFYCHIYYAYKQPITAQRNRKELYDRIKRLPFFANAIGKNEYVQKMFGKKARHITYKKMAIIFFVEQETIYIQRIIASSLIH